MPCTRNDRRTSPVATLICAASARLGCSPSCSQPSPAGTTTGWVPCAISSMAIQYITKIVYNTYSKHYERVSLYRAALRTRRAGHVFHRRGDHLPALPTAGAHRHHLARRAAGRRGGGVRVRRNPLLGGRHGPGEAPELPERAGRQHQGGPRRRRPGVHQPVDAALHAGLRNGGNRRAPGTVRAGTVHADNTDDLVELEPAGASLRPWRP